MQRETPAAFPDLTRIFEPRSVVVVGASERSGNLGGETVRRLQKFRFAGPVWVINRSGEDVAGAPGFAGFGSLPGLPDLAIFAIPAEGLIEAIEAAIAVGVRAGVAYAGGLAEAGGEGIERQAELTRLCRAHGFMLCGPNCVGVINAAHPVTATFATALHELDALRKGTVSMVSQSGGIATTALAAAETAGFGFKNLVSSGNEAVVTFADYLHAFAVDEGTKVITGYLEGVRDGERFIAALEAARERDKPVVLIKAGTIGASARAAEAHTGALAGEDRLFGAILKEFGAIRVTSVEEMIDVALLLAGTRTARKIAGRGVGLVTFGGGNGVLGTDQCAQNGLTVPALSEAGVHRLKPLLVSVATAANPLDLTPTTAFRAESLALLPDALDALADEPAIDSVMFIVGSLAAKAGEIASVVEAFWRRCPKPVLVSWPAPPHGIIERLAREGIYSYLDPARGIRAISCIASRTQARVRPPPAASPVDVDWDVLTAAHAVPGVVTEDRCHALLREAGLPVAEGRLATSAEEAVATAAAMGFPVALKGISPAVTHRAEAGLLAIGLADEGAVAEAFARLSATAETSATSLTGLYVQKMQPKGGELLVAAVRDPIFGVMVTCGAGGGLTELLDDVAIARAPVDAATARDMVERLRVRPHLKDEYGVLPVEAAAEFLARFSAIVAGAPWSRFVFEVNPVMVSRDRAVAVDGLLIIEER